MEKRVLIVAPNPRMLATGRVLARKVDIEIKSCANAAEAMEILREQLIDLVITEAFLENDDVFSFIHDVRTLDLKKQPSVSETIDWARVLVLLQATELGHEMVKDTLNVLLKYETDIEATLPQVTTFVAKASRQNVFG